MSVEFPPGYCPGGYSNVDRIVARSERHRGVFRPVLQNPAAHLEVLRNPTHPLAHNDDYLSPALHNSSEIYLNRLTAQADDIPPWLLTNQSVEVSKNWRGFQDVLNSRCATFTLKPKRIDKKEALASDAESYSEYLEDLNEAIKTEMDEKGWDFTRKEWMDINDSVHKEKAMKYAASSEDESSGIDIVFGADSSEDECSDIDVVFEEDSSEDESDDEDAVASEEDPVNQAATSYSDNHNSFRIDSEATSNDLAGAGDLGIIMEPKPVRALATIIGSPPRSSSKSDVSLSTIYEMESLEFSLTTSESDKESAITQYTAPMTPKLQSAQFGSMPTLATYDRPCYDSSISSESEVDTDSDSDSDDDDDSYFSPAKAKRERYLKDFRESRLSAQTKLAMQAEANKKMAQEDAERFKAIQKDRQRREVEINTICNVVSLQLRMDLENIRLTSASPDAITYKNESGSKEVHFVRGIINTLFADEGRNELINTCTTRLVDDGNWKLLEDPLTIEEYLHDRSEEELQEWSDTRRRFIEQERKPNDGESGRMELFDEAKRRMQNEFIWDVVNDELQKLENLESTNGGDSDDDDDDDRDY
ncbi:hypothetical protein F5884DRAFT_744744 [Xylogone sp. PMI_703]|nr:hypothetical protein F5884DRAFT_744744 [Xylogone sp. PMI_703]